MPLRPRFPVCSAAYATSVSSLWTPEGEHRVAAAGDKGPAPGTSDAGPLGSTRDRLTAEGEIDEAAVAQLAELRRQNRATRAGY
jgi:hypothetical protein